MSFTFKCLTFSVPPQAALFLNVHIDLDDFLMSTWYTSLSSCLLVTSMESSGYILPDLSFSFYHSNLMAEQRPKAPKFWILFPSFVVSFPGALSVWLIEETHTCTHTCACTHTHIHIHIYPYMRAHTQQGQNIKARIWLGLSISNKS